MQREQNTSETRQLVADVSAKSGCPAEDAETSFRCGTRRDAGSAGNEVAASIAVCEATTGDGAS